MASRDRYTSASPSPVTGPQVLDNLDGHLTTMYNGLPLELTLTSGSEPDDLTGTLDPVLDGSGLAQGMSFWLETQVDNAGSMTLAIDGGSALALLDETGAGLLAASLVAGGRYLISFDGVAYRVVSNRASEVAGLSQLDVFTASGTLSKPAGFPDEGLVIIEGWGGGSSGGAAPSSAPYGTGGAYAVQYFRGSDFGATTAVTVGPGGTGIPNASGPGGDPGGDTLVGSIFKAFGGLGDNSAVPGIEDGGSQARPNTYLSGAASDGVSEYGGDGGASEVSVGSASPGSAPGGAGGRKEHSGTGTSGDGARGEVRVRWIA